MVKGVVSFKTKSGKTITFPAERRKKVNRVPIGTRNGRPLYRTKNGQPYVLKANGMAMFVKK